jgi:hypothetical protein
LKSTADGVFVRDRKNRRRGELPSTDMQDRRRDSLSPAWRGFVFGAELSGWDQRFLENTNDWSS